MVTLNTIARKIASSIVRQKAYDNEGRWIWHKEDLTERDKAEILRVRNDVKHILTTGNGQAWANVLAEIHGIATESFYIGFREQDKIIDECANNGIYFAR